MLEWSDTFRHVQGKAWADSIPQELEASLEELADLIVTNGREPHWGAVLETVRQKWPQSTPKRAETIRVYIRRLVEERRNG